MKKYLTLAMFVVLATALISPVSVSAKTKAGTKPGSFFYFFDKAFEKADLFFTFNPENKAKKALENADERLAEAEESANENNQEAVSEAMKDYQKNIEVLEKVLAKVPEEAKEAITKAIEADKERREEMTKKIEEIKEEIKKEDNDFKKDEEEKLKSNDDVGDNENGKEKVENENKDGNKKGEQKKEIEKLKKDVETLKQKQPQVKIIEKIIEKEKPITIEKKESSSSQAKQNENIVTLPNGAVVEMDGKGNVVKTIKEVEATPQVSTFKHVIVNVPQYVSREIKKGETNVPFLSLRLQSVGDAPVRVESVNVRIVGSVVAIKTVKIENCGIAQSLSDKGEATLVCPLSIKNGSSNNYNIVADISDDISSENGKTIQVSVESIKANDATVSGEFPIVSAPHKIVSPLVIEETKIVVKPGQFDTRYIFSAIKITSDKKVFLKSIKWYQSGNGGAGDAKTYVDNISYDAISDGKYFTSNFGGIVINPNETKEIYIKGDNISQYYQWLSFDIYKASDINITDENGNVVIPQAEQLWNYENSGGFRSGSPWYDGYKVEIKN